MASQPQGHVMSPEEDEDEILSGGTLSQLEEADRRSQVAIAKQYPRSVTLFRQKLTEIARMNQAVAMEMVYSLPRAGKQLIGPSIRFAEAILSCWGNNRAGVEVVDVNVQEGYVVAEGRFYDCEQNAGIAIRVRRRNVMTKKDADSFQVTGNAASSIALRGAILRGVPKALWADIFQTVVETAAGSVASVAQTRADLLKTLQTLGATQVKILRALGVSGVADIGTEGIVAMSAWVKQLTSKETTLEDLFGFPEDDEIDSLMDQLKMNEAQKGLHRRSFATRKGESLEYLRGELAKMGGGSGPQPVGAQKTTRKQAAPVEAKPEAAAADPTEAASPTGTDTPSSASSSTTAQPVSTTQGKPAPASSKW